MIASKLLPCVRAQPVDSGAGPTATGGGVAGLKGRRSGPRFNVCAARAGTVLLICRGAGWTTARGREARTAPPSRGRLHHFRVSGATGSAAARNRRCRRGDGERAEAWSDTTTLAGGVYNFTALERAARSRPLGLRTFARHFAEIGLEADAHAETKSPSRRNLLATFGSSVHRLPRSRISGSRWRAWVGCD